MAKIEIIHPAKDDVPGYSESIEIRVWAQCGNEAQPFYIGSGLNFHANGTLWLEMMYCVEGAQVFYARNFLNADFHGTADQLADRFEKMVEEGNGELVLCGMLPETGLEFKLERSQFRGENGEEQQSSSCDLTLFADTGVVFGFSGPGDSGIKLTFPGLDFNDGVRFMRELILEFAIVEQGKHLDPANFAEGSSEWPFLDQLNRRAYDRASVDYEEEYFELESLAEMFDSWMGRLPARGQVLDAGCGHGQPVIARLLERGFQVTGSDFSPAMLARAEAQFPQARFIHSKTTEIAGQSIYDGICSFNSVLYLDPVDLLNSIRRLQRALKPDGLLFLYAWDAGPDWRGEPFHYTVRQWMWSWHYGMDEACALLEEHGYFKVLAARKVWVDPEDAERVAREMEKQKQEEEEYYRRQAENNTHWPYLKMTVERKPYAYAILAQRRERG